jgi:hypothetical protein
MLENEENKYLEPYLLGDAIGFGAQAKVHIGVRKTDGLKVAVKRVKIQEFNPNF